MACRIVSSPEGFCPRGVAEFVRRCCAQRGLRIQGRFRWFWGQFGEVLGSVGSVSVVFGSVDRFGSIDIPL
eukprot:12879893-Alexandrium_andersonii.AAC.1